MMASFLKKIFKKHEGYSLLEGQTWFPPEKGNKSTLGVVDYLRRKHNALRVMRYALRDMRFYRTSGANDATLK